MQLGDLHARIQLALDDELGTAHGLSYADFRLLRHIAAAPGQGVALTDLVPCLGVPMSSVLRQILPMEKTGLLVRGARTGAAGGRTIGLRSAARPVLLAAIETAQYVCCQLALPSGAAPGAATVDL
jgi:DNA-binding MarR family transcriptional regulator